MDCTGKNKHLLAHTPSAQGGGYQSWRLSQVGAAATGSTYNTANNLWNPQSPMCNRKSAILPLACPVYCYCLWLRYWAWIGLSSVYYPPMVSPFAKQFLVMMNGFLLISRRCQQSNNDTAPLQAYICDYNNWCSFFVGLRWPPIIRHQLRNTSVLSTDRHLNKIGFNIINNRLGPVQTQTYPNDLMQHVTVAFLIHHTLIKN